jgi:hypothetical protein
VVDITNLENGKNVRVIVSAGLEAPGLLAVLSGNAAGLLGLRNGSIGRIRMTQPSDPIAFSRFTEGMAAYRDDYASWNPMTGESAYTPPPSPEPAPFIGMKDPASDESPDPDSDSLSTYIPESEWDEFNRREVVDLPAASVPDEVSAPPLPENGIYDYTLTPAEERTPQAPPGDFIDPEHLVSNEGDGLPAREEYPSSSIPVISSLERGKYYVQIGAFSRAELIEAAVYRIDESYPLTIQNAGSDAKPVYRLLLGPLNLGESGAMLQRVKSVGYKDAFVRSIK